MKKVVKVDERLCKGCRICVEFCPKKVLDLNKNEKATMIDQENCILCSLCEIRCPDFAIYLEEEE